MNTLVVTPYNNQKAITLCNREGKRTWVQSKDILRLEGNSNYTWVYLSNGQKILMSITLKRFEEKLPEFIRINKTDLVNPDFVRNFSVIPTQNAGGIPYIKNYGPWVSNSSLILKTGDGLPWSRRRYRYFMHSIKDLN